MINPIKKRTTCQSITNQSLLSKINLLNKKLNALTNETNTAKENEKLTKLKNIRLIKDIKNKDNEFRLIVKDHSYAISEFKNDLTQKDNKIHTLTNENKKIRSKLDNYIIQLKLEKQKTMTLEEDIAFVKIDLMNKERLYRSFKKLYDGCENQMNETHGHMGEAVEKLLNQDTFMANLLKKIETLTNISNMDKQMIDKLNNDIVIKDKEIENLKLSENQLLQKNSSLKDKISSFELKEVTLNNEVIAQHQEIKKLKEKTNSNITIDNELVKKLKNDINLKNELINSLKSTERNLQNEIIIKDNEIQKLKSKIDNNINNNHEDVQKLEKDIILKDGKIKRLEFTEAKLNNQIFIKDYEIGRLNGNNINNYNAEVNKLEKDILFKNVKKNSRDFDENRYSDEMALKEKNDLLLTRNFLENDKIRRLKHHQEMLLKGNMRVFCRIRPFLLDEIRDNKNLSNNMAFIIPDIGPNSQQIMISNHPTSSLRIDMRLNNNDLFKFDRVLGPETTQEYLYDEISLLVQSAMDGKNICILAYGQTGSGKTFTMHGNQLANSFNKIKSNKSVYNNREKSPFKSNLIHKNRNEINNKNKGLFNSMSFEPFADKENNNCIINNNNNNNKYNNHTISNHGIVGLALNDIINIKSQNNTNNVIECHIYIQMIEIYCDTIIDLLGTNKSSKCTVFNDLNDNMILLNASEHEVHNINEALELLAKGRNARTTRSTKCNIRSSRSHCITTIKIERSMKNGLSNNTKISRLSLVDLAGSENMNLSGSIHDKEILKESQAINLSLNALSNCMSALAQKKRFIPFRDSKLTRVLQRCLHPDSLSLFICNLSPTINQINESRNSLRFAKKVTRIHSAVPAK